MAILRSTSFHEISAAITDEELNEVQIGLTGIYFSTREVAIADLRAAAGWLESGETLEYEERQVR